MPALSEQVEVIAESSPLRPPPLPPPPPPPPLRGTGLLERRVHWVPSMSKTTRRDRSAYAALARSAERWPDKTSLTSDFNFNLAVYDGAAQITQGAEDEGSAGLAPAPSSGEEELKINGSLAFPARSGDGSVGRDGRRYSRYTAPGFMFIYVVWW
ncbi:hypothetical protein KOW79_022708 [Hemibagrus wyckioides]|uniref:Uncharacterized protein n=1 Tax=Hemibagrus wyckioides TaxID=337641 RepID=A0A9D3S871_9TELE|nr:hypothetical protein KOW79_022708 [Hemibagrus wyckioides]